MDKLVALPVSGDSFLLCRNDRNILVDGGYSSKRLVSALAATNVAISHLHIVVCTHADIDHAGGLTDLLDSQSICVDEFWLPGSWTDSLPDLLKSPEMVVTALVTEFEQELSEVTIDNEQQDYDEFELRLHANIAAVRSNTRRRVDTTSEKSLHQALRSDLTWLELQAVDKDLGESNAAASSKAFEKGRRRIRYQGAKRKLNKKWISFGLELINTAERIRKIAVQAIRHHVKVRWFDFGKFSKTRCAHGGEADLLVPLNAVEIVFPPPPNKSLNYIARLTPVNEESLVFLSPGIYLNKLGVLFTGDSPLGEGPRYDNSFLDCSSESLRYLVVTAPHHGAQSNFTAYKHLNNFAKIVLWLRSGGSKKHPGSTFRALPASQRACTNCPHLKRPREEVEVQLSCSPTWPFYQFRVRAHNCNC